MFWKIWTSTVRHVKNFSSTGLKNSLKTVWLNSLLRITGIFQVTTYLSLLRYLIWHQKLVRNSSRGETRLRLKEYWEFLTWLQWPRKQGWALKPLMTLMCSPMLPNCSRHFSRLVLLFIAIESKTENDFLQRSRQLIGLTRYTISCFNQKTLVQCPDKQAFLFGTESGAQNTFCWTRKKTSQQSSKPLFRSVNLEFHRLFVSFHKMQFRPRHEIWKEIYVRTMQMHEEFYDVFIATK